MSKSEEKIHADKQKLIEKLIRHIREHLDEFFEGAAFPQPVPPQPVFFITGIEVRPLSSYHERYIEYMLQIVEGGRERPMLNTRTFGFHPCLEGAKKWVLENISDISEGGTFKWMVIEGYLPGLYIYRPTIQVFFEFRGDWEEDAGHYVEIDACPKEVVDLCNDRLLACVNDAAFKRTFTSIG